MSASYKKEKRRHNLMPVTTVTLNIVAATQAYCECQRPEMFTEFFVPVAICLLF
jgi:hypothetical protein